MIVVNNIIFKDSQLVIPNSVKADINRLYYTHLGILKQTYLNAKELVYWPEMFKEITNIINNCVAYLTFQNVFNQNRNFITFVSSTRPTVFTNC